MNGMVAELRAYMLSRSFRLLIEALLVIQSPYQLSIAQHGDYVCSQLLLSV